MRHPDDRSADARFGAGGPGSSHADEGTIHAWLDDALPPEEAAALERHVAACAGCRARVAEARGLIAASSRILAALDVVPGGVIPASRDGDDAALPAAAAAAAPVAVEPPATAAVPAAATAAPTPTTDDGVRPLRPGAAPPARGGWQRWRVQALAAVALLAVGTTVVLQRAPDQAAEFATIDSSSSSDASMTAEASAPQAPEPVVQAPASPMPAGTAGSAAASPEARTLRSPSRPLADASEGIQAQKAAPAPRVAAAPAPPPLPSIPAPVLPPVPPGREAAALRAAPPLALASPEADGRGVTGRVVTAGTGAPVAEARVALAGVNRAAVSDSGGRFSLGPLPPGRYTGSVRRIGYAPAPVEVVVRDSAAATSVDVALRPIPITLNEVVATGAAPADEARRERGGASAAAPAPPVAAPQREVTVLRGAVAGALAPAALAGCWALEVTGGGSGADRRAVDRALPGTVALLTTGVEDQPGWLAVTSGTVRGALPVAGARWRVVAPDSLEMVWSGGETPVQLFLRAQGETLTGTAVRGAAGAAADRDDRDDRDDRRDVRVTARRRACPGG